MKLFRFVCSTNSLNFYFSFSSLLSYPPLLWITYFYILSLPLSLFLSMNFYRNKFINIKVKSKDSNEIPITTLCRPDAFSSVEENDKQYPLDLNEFLLLFLTLDKHWPIHTCLIWTLTLYNGRSGNH